MVNVGKYTSPMDAMGYEPLFAEIARSQESKWKNSTATGTFWRFYKDIQLVGHVPCETTIPTGEMLESVSINNSGSPKDKT